MGTGGLYMFGGNRIWGREAQRVSPTNSKTRDGKNKLVIPAEGSGQAASISAFFQYGINNSETLPINQSFGLGFTGFGLVPNRPIDSVGIGASWAWLNPNLFDRSSELMFQTYYQAHLFAGAFLQPGVSYIPTPGGSSSFGGAWGLTMRLTFLF